MEEAETTTRPGSDVKYLLAVAGLLMFIIIMLSVLWLRERYNARELQAQLDILHHKGDLGQILARQVMPTSRALQREDLPAETVTWNGRGRTVMKVSPAAGERLGLKPGDVILVTAPPASAPAMDRLGPTTQPTDSPSP